MSEKSKLKQNLAELKAIIDWFESDDIDLNEAIAKFEAGAKKADEIKRELGELENKITVLKQNFSGEK